MPGVLSIRNTLNLADGFQAIVEFAAKGMAAFIGIPEAQQIVGTLIPSDDFLSLRLELNGVELGSFGTTINQTAVGSDRVLPESQQVDSVNADEEKGELEDIEIPLLPGKHIAGEQGTQLLYRERTLCGRLGLDFELPKRVGRGNTIVDGIVEDSPDVAKMNSPGIYGLTTRLRQEYLELRQPVLSNGFEAQRRVVRFEGLHLFQGNLVDFTGAIGLTPGDEIFEP